MAMPILKESLCGCSVRTGSKIIGWCNFICLVILTSLTSGVIIMSFAGFLDEYKEMTENKIRFQAIAIMCFMCFAFGTIFYSLLLIGIYKRKPDYIFRWMFWSKLCLFWQVIAIAKTLMLTPIDINDVVGELLYFALNVYSLIIVNSHYTELLGSGAVENSGQNI